MTRDVERPSGEGKGWVRLILTFYVKDMINDDDYVRLERELLNVIRAERGLAARTAARSRLGGRPPCGRRPDGSRL